MYHAYFRKPKKYQPKRKNIFIINLSDQEHSNVQMSFLLIHFLSFLVSFPYILRWWS